MGAMALIDGSKTGNITESGTLWKTEELGIGKSAPLKVDNRLYCFDDAGKLWVVDATTGEKIGKRFSVGTMGRAESALRGRQDLLPGSQRAMVGPQAGRQAGREGPGQRQLRHGRGMQCLADRQLRPGLRADLGGHLLFRRRFEASGRSAGSAATFRGAGERRRRPALVQVVPCEALLKPGATQKFTVKLFNAHGQFLKESPATFAVEGPGAMQSDGTFQAPTDAGHVATFVTAKVGELTGKARIRIVPPSPGSSTSIRRPTLPSPGSAPGIDT